MCVIELISYRTAEGRIEEKAYTRICENGVSGRTCENTVIRDSGLRDLSSFAQATGLYGEASVNYPNDPSIMANEGLISGSAPSTIEVASTGERARKTGKKYMIRRPPERTSVLTSFFRGARDRAKEKKYRDNDPPPAPEPPAVNFPGGEGGGAPPPPPPTQQTRRQSFSADRAARPSAPPYPPIDTSAAAFNRAQPRQEPRSESSPINVQYTPARRDEPYRRRNPPVLHQPTEYPSHFLPPGMSPTDSHFSSFSPSRGSSPFNTGFGQAPHSTSAYASPNTPLDAYPLSYDYKHQNRPNHHASQSQPKLDGRSDVRKDHHVRSVSDGQASLPTFARNDSDRSRTKPIKSKLPPEVTQEPQNESDQDEPPRSGKRRRHRHSHSYHRERQLEDKIAELTAQLAQLQNAQPTSPTGTDRTVRPNTEGRSKHRSNLSEQTPTSPRPTSGGRSEATREELLQRLEALEAKMLGSEMSPTSPSVPSVVQKEASTRNPYAARVDDVEDEDVEEETVTNIDSSESVQSSPRTPSPTRKPRDRPASIHVEQPYKPATQRMDRDNNISRDSPDSKRLGDVRKERMYQRAYDTRPSLQRSYSDRVARESRPSRRDEPSESTHREKPRESSHHRSNRQDSRQSSRHRAQQESDTESTSRTIRRQSVHSGDESQSRRRLDRRDREELKRRGRSVWD